MLDDDRASDLVPQPASAAVLRVSNLGKEYRVYDSPRARLKALLTGRVYHRSHWALKDVSFELHRGQCMGVIGDNGAGKSSLLKLMAGTLQPSQGTIARIGRVTAILELGAGFHPDFSGRDNLYFGGSLIGISSADMARLEPSIIEFSELGDSIDRAVKTYSSGMAVRLAFALVTAVEPDVLIIDEALAVGDQHFQKKCVERIDTFRKNGCTILFCSHSLYHVRQLCDVALWLGAGQVQDYGATESVIASYEAHVRLQDASAAVSTQAGGSTLAPVAAPLPIPAEAVLPADAPTRGELVSVQIAHLDAGAPPLLTAPDLAVTVTARAPAGERPSIGVMLEQAHGVGLTSVTTNADGSAAVEIEPNLWRATVTFTELSLHTGEYVLSAYLFDSQGLVVYDEWMRCSTFKWIYPRSMPGLVRLPHHWS
ncbi:MAG: ABC transporter ATP-binding protein [Burkholderiales bacterium]